MNAFTSGYSRRLCARATTRTRAAKPSGKAHKVLTQRRPTRMRGTMPCCGGSQWLNRMRSSAPLSFAASGSWIGTTLGVSVIGLILCDAGALAMLCAVCLVLGWQSAG